jgi:hypothetical protein
MYFSYLDTQVSTLVNIQDWQQRNNNARQEDQKALHDRLSELESNQNRLAEMLSRYFWGA